LPQNSRCRGGEQYANEAEVVDGGILDRTEWVSCHVEPFEDPRTRCDESNPVDVDGGQLADRLGPFSSLGSVHLQTSVT
jgi:hypothetical protein